MRKIMLLGILGPFILNAMGCDDFRQHVGTCKKKLDAENVQLLTVDVGSGSFDVIGDATATEIEVIVDIFSHESERREYDAREALRFDLEKMGGSEAKLLVDMSRADFTASADVVVKLPPTISLDVKDKSGDICITDIHSLVLEANSGDIQIEDVAQDVTIVDDSGDLVLDNVGGNVDITDDSGDIEVSNVESDVRINDDSGDITVKRVDGLVTIVDKSGDIEIYDAGDVEIISDSSGDQIIR